MGDPDCDGVGNYYVKVRFRRNDVPNDALANALKGLLKKKVQVIQIE